MTTKYREGPWKSQYDDNGYYNIYSTAPPYQAITIITGESDQDKADADLIAAAPDMLEILEKCLKDELNRRNKLLNKSTAAAYSDARVEKMKAVIAKAKGLDK